MSFSSCSNSSSIVCIAMRLPPVFEADVLSGAEAASAAKAVLSETGWGTGVEIGVALEQAGQRNVHPVGPVVQLVAELVQRLVEHEDPQQAFEVVRVCGGKNATPIVAGRYARRNAALTHVSHSSAQGASRSTSSGRVARRRAQPVSAA